MSHFQPRAGNAGADVAMDPTAPRASEIFRKAFPGVLISAGGYTAESADQAIASGLVDAVAFGRLFIANPDLPERFRKNTELNSRRPLHVLRRDGKRLHGLSKSARSVGLLATAGHNVIHL